MPVPGVELLAGATVGYLVRKARRVGRRADAEVDRALDQGMDSVHDLVSRAVGDDPAIERLRAQAEAGTVTERTRRRASDAIADAAEENEEFAAALKDLVDRLRRKEAAAQASDGGIAVGRDVTQHAETGGVIARDVQGGLSTGGPTSPGPRDPA